jgi:hypothetical protein
MILYCHSNAASYLSELKARSRGGGYFYLGNKDEPLDNPKPNGAIHDKSRILKNIMAAASEAEIAAPFHNSQETVHIRQILAELDRTQPGPTQITTNNSTADGFANSRTKATQTIQGHRHEILLGPRQSRPRPTRHPMGQWQTQPWG